jgi:hypothetical protein
VWVEVPSAAGRRIAFNPRPLEVVGVLEVGNRTEGNGFSSNLRIVLDPAPRGSRKPSRTGRGKE